MIFRGLRTLNVASVRVISTLLKTYRNLDTAGRTLAINNQLIPARTTIKSELNKVHGAIETAMVIREDVQKLLETTKTPELRELDAGLKDWLGVIFCVDALQLKRITFEESSGDILEKVAHGEAVHKVRSIHELKRRLHNGRRCYGLFHPSMPAEPLAFVHIALTEKLAPSLSYLNSCNEIANPTHAMFYSVNSPHAALTGLELALRVIKQATENLRELHPSLHTFSTLSPVPGFMGWLKKISKDATFLSTLAIPEGYEKALLEYSGCSDRVSMLPWLLCTLSESNPKWIDPGPMSDAIKPVMLWLCAHYIAMEKSPSKSAMKLPLDPVSRFHLRNGAGFHGLNWLGNTSLNGVQSSATIMVNYLYNMNDSEACAAKFESTNGTFPINENIVDLINGNCKDLTYFTQ